MCNRGLYLVQCNLYYYFILSDHLVWPRTGDPNRTSFVTHSPRFHGTEPLRLYGSGAFTWKLITTNHTKYSNKQSRYPEVCSCTAGDDSGFIFTEYTRSVLGHGHSSGPTNTSIPVELALPVNRRSQAHPPPVSTNNPPADWDTGGSGQSNFRSTKGNNHETWGASPTRFGTG